MKILEIVPIITNKELTDAMLKDGVLDDGILERSFFALKVESTPAFFVDITYRRYWEKMYIKNAYTSSISDNYCLLVMSASEAIQFIYAATPPRLQHTIKAGISSCDNILQSLSVFLMENNNGEIKHYESILKKILHCEVFETQWKIKIPERKTSNDYEIFELYKSSNSSFSIFKAYTPMGIKALHDYLRTKNYEISNITIDGITIVASIFK